MTTVSAPSSQVYYDAGANYTDVQSAAVSAGSTTPGLANIFREFFHDPWIEALPQDVFLLQRIKQDQGVGKSYRTKIHYEGNQSVMSYLEQDDFGTVGHQKYLDAELFYKLYKVEIEVTNFMIAATRGQGAYIEEFTQESTRSLKDFRHKLNRHMLAKTQASASDLDSLGTIIDDGQVNSVTGYAGISFSTYPWWKPYVYNASNAIFAPSHFQAATTALETPERDANITGVLTARKHFNDFGNQFEALRRYNNTTQLQTGFTAIEFENKQIISVPGMATGDVYFLDESELLYSVLKDFDTEEKQVMRDARHLVVTHYANLMCRDLRKQGRIFNLA